MMNEGFFLAALVAEVPDQAKRLRIAFALSPGMAKRLRTLEAFDQATRLLDMRISRATIRDRLIAQFGISRRAAYRILQDVIDQRGAKRGQSVPDSDSFGT